MGVDLETYEHRLAGTHFILLLNAAAGLSNPGSESATGQKQHTEQPLKPVTALAGPRASAPAGRFVTSDVYQTKQSAIKLKR